MRFIASLKALDKASPELYGKRATSLALLAEKGVLIPHTTVLKASAGETFRASHEGKTEAEAIAMAELEEELIEAYESLGVPDGTAASDLMSPAEDHDVLIISSPQAAHPAEVIRCYGKKDFVKKAFLFLAGHGSPAILQKVINEDVSGQVIAGSEETIIVRAYAGLQNFSEQEEFDVFHVSKGELAVTKAQVGTQAWKLVREDSGVEKYPLKEREAKQKANEKEVIDMARVGKRCQGFLKEDIIAYVGIKRQKTYVFFCESASTFGAPAAAEHDSIASTDEPPLAEEISAFAKAGGKPAEVKVSALPGRFDNFIVAIQEKGSAQERADPQKILSNSLAEVKRHVLDADLAIRAVLEEKARPDEKAGTTIPELVQVLETVPYAEDILRVDELKRKFLRDPEAFTLQDLSFAFETARKFVREA